MSKSNIQVISRVIPSTPRSKNLQGAGLGNISFSSSSSSAGGVITEPSPSVEIVPTDSGSILTDQNVFSTLRVIQEILSRIIKGSDQVEATDENTYSALHIDNELAQITKLLSDLDAKYLRKDKPDSTNHLLQLNGGIGIGSTAKITKYGEATFKSVKSDKIATQLIESVNAILQNIDSNKATITNITTTDILVKALALVHNLRVEDTATLLKAVVKDYLSSPTFRSGFLGEGFRIHKTEDGSWDMELDTLTVRKVFQVFELLIQQVKHQGGVVIHSPAGGKITKVTEGGSYWKCEVEGADTFFKDDLVLCQKFTGKNIKRYWRLATSAGDGFVNLSKTDCEANSAIPEVDDEIATLGNKTNTARQSAYLISVVGADAPYTAYYSGINSYSLKGKEHTRIGNLEGVVSPVFGALKGSGAVLENAYIQGMIKLQNGKTVETVINETSNKLSSDIGKVQTDLQKDINTSVSSVKNELGATITNVENSFNTSLNSTKNELNSSINKAQGDANAAKGLAQSAQDSIDGLEIGGRNLIHKKHPMYKWVDIKNISTTSGAFIYISPAPFINAIYQLEVRAISDSLIGAKFGWQWKNIFQKPITLSKEWKRVVSPFFNSDGAIGLGCTKIGKIELRRIKAEYGNKPTDWTPAPEDTEAQINTISKEIKDVEQRFEISEGQINSHIKETTQLVTEAKNANGESVKTLEQVKVQINDINVTAGQINSTLGEVTKKQGEINSSISNLEQTAGSISASIDGFKETEAEIKATASKIEATHAGIVLEASEKSAQKAIDRLEIGVRNYLLDSDFRNNGWNKKALYDEDMGFYYQTETYDWRVHKKHKIPKGDYILSGWFKRDVGGVNPRISLSDSLQVYIDSRIKPIGEWFYHTQKIRLNSDFDGTIYLLTDTKTSFVYFAKLKLEQGNKPTDWTSAPEDTEAQIVETSAKLGVLNDKLIAEVSKTDGISKELAAVKLDHNSFKVQVKTDITGAINSNNEVIKSSFEMKDNKISLLGTQIDITGKVTFNSLDTGLRDDFQNFSQFLYREVGYLAYEDKVEKAKLGSTVIEGGFLKTDLIRANSITADKLNVGSLVARHLKTSDSGARIEAIGSELKIYGLAEHPNIVFGVNNQGYATLAYYSNDGKLIYDLGPRGIDWGSIRPAAWNEIKLVATKVTSKDPRFSDFSFHATSKPIYGTTYWKYFAGSNPTITQDEKQKEYYTYTTKGNLDRKISDGWYMTEGAAMQTQAGNTTAWVKPFGDNGLYEFGSSVRDIPPIYFRNILKYEGGQVVARKYLCWNGDPFGQGGNDGGWLDPRG